MQPKVPGCNSMDYKRPIPHEFMHRPKCEQGAFTAASSFPSLCESWFLCPTKLKNRDICCCDCHPTCPHAKNLIRTWLFGSSKCVKFRKIIFNCTIQITEEVKRCTSCSKQQDSPVINTSSVASHSWSSWKQFLTHSWYQEATTGSRAAAGSAPTLSQELGGGERHRIVLFVNRTTKSEQFWISVGHTWACWGLVDWVPALETSRSCCGRREQKWIYSLNYQVLISPRGKHHQWWFHFCLPSGKEEECQSKVVEMVKPR